MIYTYVILSDDQILPSVPPPKTVGENAAKKSPDGRFGEKLKHLAT